MESSEVSVQLPPNYELEILKLQAKLKEADREAIISTALNFARLWYGNRAVCAVLAKGGAPIERP
jgi:hypothetical protein